MTKTKKITSILLAILIAATIFVVPMSVSGASKLNKVTGINQCGCTKTGFSIRWDKVNNAAVYKIKILDSKGKQCGKIDNVEATKARRYSVSGLKSKTVYYVQMQAVAKNRKSDWSAKRKVSTTQLLKVTGVKATPKVTSVTIKWNAIFTKNYAGYRLCLMNSKKKTIVPDFCDENSASITKLKKNTTYYVKVQAMVRPETENRTYTGPYSATVKFKTKSK